MVVVESTYETVSVLTILRVSLISFKTSTYTVSGTLVELLESFTLLNAPLNSDQSNPSNSSKPINPLTIPQPILCPKQPNPFWNPPKHPLPPGMNPLKHPLVELDVSVV